MEVKKIKKKLDPSILYIGLEIECLIVHIDTLCEISREETQPIFKSLIKNGWLIKTEYRGEIQAIKKMLSGVETHIKIDLCYAIFEITTPTPFSSLEALEKNNETSLAELTDALRLHGMAIWPKGVSPAASGLFNLSCKPREEMIEDNLYKPMRRLEYQQRFCHIASHQVNIDVPLQKVIPAINALYRRLGDIIDRFANSPLLINGVQYREGRYYFWNDCVPILNTARYMHGAKPIFPPTPFANLQDFYERLWQGEFTLLFRDNKMYSLEDLTTSVNRFLRERNGIGITIDEPPQKLMLERSDIEVFFNLNWLDFKPHFDLDGSYTLEEFLSAYYGKRLDDFFKTHCQHSYLEIRPCSPHFENNAMEIPGYFYKLFNNLDAFIRESESISWDEARRKRNRAILA